MAGRGVALTRPAWLKHAEEAKLKDEEEKAAAARAAFDATFRDVDQAARNGNASSDSEADEADKLANKPIGPVDPSRCTAAGTGVGGGAAGAAASFVVVTKDSDGRRAPHGGAYIRVRITPGAGVGGTEQEAVVKDHSDGTYTVTYAVAKRGDYMVSVDCNGHPILGSPFPVFFSGGNPQVGGTTLPTSAPILGSSPFLNGVAQPMSAFPNMSMSGIFPGMLASLIPGLLPGATGGAVLPGIGASFGEVCRDYLNGRCARTDCKYNHPPQNQLMAALAAGSTMGGLSQMPMAPSAAAMAAAQSIAAAQAYQAAQAQAAAQQQHKQPSAGAGEANGEALSAEEPAGSGEPSCTIHVSNLSPGLQVDHLRQLFGYCGTVVDCKISDSKTSAYVEFSKHEEAKSALELNNMDVKGASLKLELAKPARLVKQASTVSTSTATPTATAQPAPPLPMMMQQAVAMQQLQFQQALFMQQAMATQQAAARAATVKSAAEMAAARAAEISKRLKGPNGEGQEEEEQPTRSRSQSVGKSRSKSKSKSPIRYRRNWQPQSNSRSPSRFRRDRDRRSRSRSGDRFHKRSRSIDRGPHARGGRDGYFRYHARREWEKGREREYQPRTSRRSRSRSRMRRSRSQSRSPKYRKVHGSPMRRRREEGKPTRSLRRSRSASRDRHRGSPKSSPARPVSPWRRRGKIVKEQDWVQGDQARNGHKMGMHDNPAVDIKFGHGDEDLTEKSRQTSNTALGCRVAGANDHCSGSTQEEENGVSREQGVALEAAVKYDMVDEDGTERAKEKVVAGKIMEEVEHIKVEGVKMSEKERSSHETKPPWLSVGTCLEESPGHMDATCPHNEVERHTRELKGSGSQLVKLVEEPPQDEDCFKPDDYVSLGIRSDRVVPTEGPNEISHKDDDPVARFDGDVVLAPHDEDNIEEEQDKRRERHRKHRKKHSRDGIEVDKVEVEGDGDDPDGDRDADRQGRKEKRRHKKRSRKDDEKKKRKHKHRRHRSPGGSIEGSPSVDAGRSKVAEVESGHHKRSSSRHKKKHRETSKSITCSLSSSD